MGSLPLLSGTPVVLGTLWALSLNEDDEGADYVYFTALRPPVSPIPTSSWYNTV
jgi:hypothetical protein